MEILANPLYSNLFLILDQQKYRERKGKYKIKIKK